jgi:hypothetical protein
MLQFVLLRITSVVRKVMHVSTGMRRESVAVVMTWGVWAAALQLPEPGPIDAGYPGGQLPPRAKTPPTTAGERADHEGVIDWARARIEAPCSGDPPPIVVLQQWQEQELSGRASAWLTEAQGLSRDQWRRRAGLRVAAGVLLAATSPQSPATLEYAADACFSGASDYRSNGQTSEAACAFDGARASYLKIIELSSPTSELHERATLKLKLVPQRK